MFIFFVLVNISYNAQNKVKVNTKYNKQYTASRKKFVGTLNNEDYQEIRNIILKELRVDVPENKSILINYYQFGTNCAQSGLRKKYGSEVIDNEVRISARLSSKFNTMDFFLYSSDALNKERYENRSKFIMDSGFFSESIFSLKENCSAFFILKPNGQFMKYYGSDYFSEVQDFLSQK